MHSINSVVTLSLCRFNIKWVEFQKIMRMKNHQLVPDTAILITFLHKDVDVSTHGSFFAGQNILLRFQSTFALF